MIPPLPLNESARLTALRRYKILDTEPEEEFDHLTALASYICETPIALISLVDESRQWFKSAVGTVERQTSRDQAFCAHAILDDQMMVVEDAASDVRFANNALVLGDPHIRFYAGAALSTPDGFKLGTLCVIDREPRQLDGRQLQALLQLRTQAEALFTLRHTLHHLHEALDEVKILSGILPICSYCKNVKDEEGRWHKMEKYIRQRSEAEFSHGICGDCAVAQFPDYADTLKSS